AETKITFDPGSIEINESTGAILDRLAEILPDCRHVDMEIGGHTDSQGREEMNLTLSQARADAVLNGLLARRVLVSNLSARGYGEANPIADNDTEEGREQNRRIEFKLIDRTAAENDTPEEAADAEAPAGEEAQQ
ncbi:MAG: OmpA family protein, partial [Paracoccaceae bacterium]